MSGWKQNNVHVDKTLYCIQYHGRRNRGGDGVNPGITPSYPNFETSIEVFQNINSNNLQFFKNILTALIPCDDQETLF
jgi:adenine specific DNA methylase Mod